MELRGLRFGAAAVVVAALLLGCTRGAENALDAADTAQETAAQAQLLQASATAGNYFATNQSYAGFNAAAARSFEPGLKWVDDADPKPGMVSIRGVSPTSIVLVAQDEDGQFYCVAQNNGVDTQGTANARTAAECTGGW